MVTRDPDTTVVQHRDQPAEFLQLEYVNINIFPYSTFVLAQTEIPRTFAKIDRL